MAFSQVRNDKSMILISTKYNNNQCKYVAFRVTSRKIEIDNCYDIDLGKFNSIKTVNLLDEKFISRVYRKSTDKLIEYEKEISATNCDYLAPITILISENGKDTKIELKSIRNCYPKSMKVLIEGLEKTFEKYK